MEGQGLASAQLQSRSDMAAITLVHSPVLVAPSGSMRIVSSPSPDPTSNPRTAAPWIREVDRDLTGVDDNAVEDLRGIIVDIDPQRLNPRSENRNLRERHEACARRTSPPMKIKASLENRACIAVQARLLLSVLSHLLAIMRLPGLIDDIGVERLRVGI